MPERVDAALQDEPSRWAVVRNMPTESCQLVQRIASLQRNTRTQCSRDPKHAKQLNVFRRQNRISVELWGVSGSPTQEQKAPGNGALDRQRDEQRAQAFELKALILTAGLEGFEEFLDEPTLAVGINHSCYVRLGIDRLGCHQAPDNRRFSGGRVDFTNFDDL